MRNSTVDLFRFLGALGVVYFHHKLPMSWVGLAAVPMFTMMLVFFEAARPKEPAVTVLDRASARLMVPWAAWSLVYAAAKIAEINLGKSTFEQEFPDWVLWVGPALHLWFLPFAFSVVLLVRPVVDGLSKSDLSFWIVLALFQVLSIHIDYSGVQALSIPIQQWAAVLPAVVFGLAMFLARSSGTKTVILVWLAVINLAVGALWFGPGNMVQTALAGIVSASVCLVYSQSAAWASQLGKTAIIVYLVHPLFAAAMARLVGLGEDDRWLSFVAVSILSTAFALVLSHPLAQWSTWKAVWRDGRAAARRPMQGI